MKINKVAILYICTGSYVVFWKDFYTSFQEFFLPQASKEYFVFTDKDDLYKNENVHLIHIEHMEWPYITLLRFDFFLKVKEELKEFDFIYFFNSNMKCNKVISEQEILPDIVKKEKLVVAVHPLYQKVKSRHCPFERDKKSLAYVSYSNKNQYIMGSLNGGEKNAYLSLITQLAADTKHDIENGFIAKVHDESYLNAYIIKQPDYQIKYLSPSYIYPMEFKPDYPAYIQLIDKRGFFDVYQFKKSEKKNIVVRAVNKAKRYLYEDVNFILSLIKER